MIKRGLNKEMKITIAGNPGSGKSAVSNWVAQRFGIKKYSAGDMRRMMAVERGITIDELNKIGENEAWTDKEVDEYQKKVGEKEDNFVIDGRLSWFFIPDSVKIFLKVDKKIGAERIFKAKRSSEKAYKSVEEAESIITERVDSDKKRYQKIYGVDPYDFRNHDIILDTSSLSEHEVPKEVEKALKKFLEIEGL